MTAISHFIPSGELCRVLFQSGLRRPLPLNLVRAYIGTATREGDVVLDPFCQDSSVIFSAVQTGRRVVAASFSPLNALYARNEVIPPAADKLDAALLRLSNTLKLDTPLWKHLGGLYQTRCSGCQRPVEADYFIWEREKDQPVQVYCTCRACRRKGFQDVTEQDLHRLEGIEERGFHYAYVLSRLAGKSEKGQEFDRGLLELYTRRNLYVLTALLLKIETLFAASEMISPLRLLLLRCLEVGSKLQTVFPESAMKPRQSLRIPDKFLEINIWQAFETAASSLRQWRAPVQASVGADPKSVSSPDLFSVHWAEDERPSVFIGQRSTRELVSEISPESVTLVISRAPAFELAYGALSYLWSGWLFGNAAAARMRARLWHRFPDWPWYAGALGTSLATLGVTLRPGTGRVVLIYRSRTLAHTEALLLAAGSAGLRVENLVFARQSDAGGRAQWDYRLTLARNLEKRRKFADSETLAKAMQDAVLDGAECVLQPRAEPVGEHRLRCAIWQHLSESRLLDAEVADDELPMSLTFVREQMETALVSGMADGSLSVVSPKQGERIWWMNSLEGRSPEGHPPERRPPLSDQVDEALRDILLRAPSQDRQSILEALYKRFPDLLTPNGELIEACLTSYGQRLLGGHYALRDEDRPMRLSRELVHVVDALTLLGERLGFRTHVEDPFLPVLWDDGEGQATWAFHWLPSAALGGVLSIEVLSTPHPVLVTPCRRLELIEHRLARSPVLRDGLRQRGWEFLQTKQLWALADNDRARMGDFLASLGLRPPIERDREQLTLFREG
ncbi:MAG: hypothetical protein L6435_16455 [Anaerolineae bacterium]|nr:hypothetical protein [Anaerolineae bacterium]